MRQRQLAVAQQAVEHEHASQKEERRAERFSAGWPERLFTHAMSPRQLMPTTAFLLFSRSAAGD